MVRTQTPKNSTLDFLHTYINIERGKGMGNGDSLSGPPSWVTASTNLSWSSVVQRSLGLGSEVRTRQASPGKLVPSEGPWNSPPCPPNGREWFGIEEYIFQENNHTTKNEFFFAVYEWSGPKGPECGDRGLVYVVQEWCFWANEVAWDERENTYCECKNRSRTAMSFVSRHLCLSICIGAV